ncbi:RNA polymerase-binding protein DksA [Desulfohalovibrio reitneri]|uniref:RNA polymerase-binding protein DksA n=1 Tax=Desulfohalovibrio reitneri TaxID=1307759 RepID=UPI0004A6CC9D|nr:RNA polymerase-binding protein DksA [Desulfohalovibrio reitneri]
MKQEDIDYFHELLKEQLDEVLRTGEETIEDMGDSPEVYADPADRATAESDRSFTLRLRDRERKLAKKIQEAINRIEDGSFGICEDCGEDIAVARLKARPVTTLCIKCKSNREREEDQRGD